MKRLNVASLTSALVCAGFLTLAVVVSFAQEKTGGAKSEKELSSVDCHLECYGDGLNLSDAQKLQMRERIERHHEATAGLREQLRTLCHESSSTEGVAAVNEATVRAAAQTRANLQVELEVAHARLTSELNNLLTPEQKATRLEQQRQRQERTRAWRSRHAN